MRGALKTVCDVFFYEMARRIGIDRIAAMANRFGLGVDSRSSCRAPARGLMPTREWREAQGKPWTSATPSCTASARASTS